jgi:hypothetical protein
MKNILVFILAIVYASIVLGQTVERKTVAVIPAEGQSVTNEIKNGITNGLEEGVYRSGEYKLLARGEAFTKALTEMQFQEGGAVADNQLIQFGNALGANFVCYASVNKYSEDMYRISYRMIDVASAEIVNVGSETVRKGIAGLLDDTDNIAQKLFGVKSETAIRNTNSNEKKTTKQNDQNQRVSKEKTSRSESNIPRPPVPPKPPVPFSKRKVQEQKK